MNFRTTLLIVILLVGVAGAYFLFFQEPIYRDLTQEQPPIHEVYRIERDALQQVELSFADVAYQNLKLVKDTTGNWQLKTPFQARADNGKMNEMLDDILNKRVKQTLEVLELTQYGLETPAITFSLWTDGTSPRVTTFFIGKKAINYSVYIKEKSEPHIFLIESSALDDLTKSPTDLRDRSVVKFNPESVSEIQLTSGVPPRTLNCEKRDGGWHMTHPIKAKADVQEIERILSELLLLKVATFEATGTDATAAKQLETYGLDAPRLQIELRDRERIHALDIGSAVPPENGGAERVYVRDLQYASVYTVSDDIYRLLNTSVFDLRDKRVLDFQRTATNRFVISIEGQLDVICTKRYDNSWEVQTPTGKISADAKAVDDLLFGVDSLEASAYPKSPTTDLASYGLATPAIQIAFTQQGEKEPAVLLIGDTLEDGTVYVKAENSPQVVRVKRRLIDKIALGAAGLRDKQVLNFHIDAAIRLTMRGAEIAPFTCQRLGTQWRLTAPVKEAANNAEVNAILYELDNLTADGFVGSESVATNSTTGFSDPHLHLTVELRDQKVYTLQVGKTDASGRFYARLQHEPDLIFLLNPELVPKLKTTLSLLRTPEQ